MNLHDYIIDHAAVDWRHVLSSWAWLLPRELTVWMVNRFGDLFVVQDDGAVYLLDSGAGTLERIADSRDHFCRLLDEGDNAKNWLMIPLVDRLVAAGRPLSKGQCYSYALLPVLGGGYTPENTKAVDLATHFKVLGPIHEKLKDVPDGAHFKFEIAG